uniref:PNPLA domain-containing protein n=1 Tax=Chrysocystis fragilis TaxID=1411660 RepID=A0A7S0TAI9_9STRA
MIPRFNRFSYQVMRWPLLALMYSIIGVELIVYVALRVFVRAMEMAVATPAHRELRRALRKAENYETWLECARALDASKGVALWQADLRSTRYNWPFVKDAIGRLRAGREHCDWRAVVMALRLCSRPNVGGIMTPQLFSATYTGAPKTVVTDFIEEVVASIQWLTKFALEERATQRPDNDITVDRFSCFATARELFAAARESYGRTVLSLSGGGSLGTYHFGVVRALWRQGLLPDILCGTSAGAIVAAFVCTRDDEELERDVMDDAALRTNLCCFDQTTIECLVSLFRTGSLYDGRRWMEQCRWFANDSDSGVHNMTFLEAYQRSHRKLAITVCAKGKRAPPVLLTHLTSPHVVIASAIVATAGVPALIKPMILLEKDPETGRVAPQPGGESYIDGSIVHDIPTVGLKEAFNARFVIASQVNPHIAPLLYHTQGSVGDPSRWSSPRVSEDSWRGGFILASIELFLKSDMQAKLQFLSDVDATPGWSGRVLTQNFLGTVTITPALRFRDYFEVFKNPDEQTFPRFLHEGALAAYQKIEMIRTRFAVERALVTLMRPHQPRVS